MFAIIFGMNNIIAAMCFYWRLRDQLPSLHTSSRVETLINSSVSFGGLDCVGGR
jgi:hypothetical protein